MSPKSFAICCFALALVWPPFVAADDKPADDAKAIQGTWQMTHSEEEGVKMPTDRVKECVCVLDNGKLVMKYQGKIMAEGTYKIDPAKTPRQIDMIQNDEVGRGIYKLEKDRLTICASAFPSNKTRPDEFSTKAESRTMLLILERQKK